MGSTKNTGIGWMDGRWFSGGGSFCAESNPTLCKEPKYRGIGRTLVAYGIKLSVDAGFNGDVTLDAKTPELAKHYERDFGAIPLPGRGNGAAPRYLICDEAAIDIFTSYLEEG